MKVRPHGARGWKPPWAPVPPLTTQAKVGETGLGSAGALQGCDPGCGLLTASVPLPGLP